MSWLNSSVTLLVSKAPLNRTVKNGCFWVDPPFRFRVQKANFAFLFSGGLKKKADPPINFPLLTKSVTWDTVCSGTSSVNASGSDWQGADGRQCQAELRPDHRVQDWGDQNYNYMKCNNTWLFRARTLSPQTLWTWRTPTSGDFLHFFTLHALFS